MESKLYIQQSLGDISMGAQDRTASIRVEVDDYGRGSDVESEEIGEQISSPFDPEKIEVMTRNTTVSLLLSRIRRNTIDLAPDFQRRAGIWTPQAQSRLIESLLLRIALPTLYAAEGEGESWAVVDGVQRLTTIARFVTPEAIGAEPLRLTGLEYLVDYNGYSFADLPGRLQTRIEETELVVLLIRRGTPEEVKFNIFARINTGGQPLTRQELRHALIPGRARDFLAQMASSAEFQKATGGSVSPERMSDREMCLRYAAFLLTPPERYDNRLDFDGFLRKTMSRLNGLTEQQLQDISTSFNRAMRDSASIFGVHAFRKQYRDYDRRSPVNKAIFETQAVTVSHLRPEEVAYLQRSSDVVRAHFIDLMEDTDFYDAVSAGTGDVKKVRLRFSRMAEMLKGVLNA